MRIRELRLVNFRGFSDTTIVPRGHVLLVGEARAGRSDLVEALRRVLTPDSTRFPLSEPLDFHAGRVDRRAEVTVVLGDLGADLQQHFFDELEVWDSEGRALVEELGPLDALPEGHELVVRLCYRAQWDSDQKVAEHWVDYPKLSDPATESWVTARRAQREALPFAAVQSSARPLDLAPRSTFRRVVEASDGGDFAGSIDLLTSGFAELAAELARGLQVGNALEQVMAALRGQIRPDVQATEVVRFLPEGGSLGAIIRSLGPALDLGDGAGALPLSRHGSTMRALLGVSEALFSVAGTGGVIVADDFGEDLDTGSAVHLAACIRARASQAWLSTRRAAAADAFEPEEIVRLARGLDGRRVFYGPITATKAERVAAQIISRRVLPEAAATAIAVGEGIHDSTALSALARRLFADGAALLPSASGLSIVDAATGLGGGVNEVPKVTAAARLLGMRAVAFIDWDRDAAAAQDALDSALASADCVVRLPRGRAIEAALLEDLDDQVIFGALRELKPLMRAFSVTVPQAVWGDAGLELRRSVARLLKSGVGFHEQFIEALPEGVYPPLALRLLRAVVEAGRGERVGLVQL